MAIFMLLKNHLFVITLLVAAFAVNAYLCSISIVWLMTFCILGPQFLLHILSRFVDEAEHTDEYEDFDWNCY